MIIETPKTKEDFEAIKQTIIELMQNPYADERMIEKLKVKLINTENKLKEL
jgi:hypothetical protein